jgi:opacity protein-like surface antigen
MGSKKSLITGAVIAAVAAAAILVPSVAAGVPLVQVFPAPAVVAPDDGPGNNGRGNAFGHDKDSPDFPGNKGNGDKSNGNAFGHDKDSPDFPGNNAAKRDKNEDGPGNNGRGNAFGHDKDSPDFPGNNGNGDDDSDDE